MQLRSDKNNYLNGSNIGIVTPSTTRVGATKSAYGRNEKGAFTKEEIRAELVEKFNSKGFRVNFPEDAIDPPIAGLNWANSVEERTRHIVNMLNDQSIDAIWCFSGGESAIEVAEMLNQYDKNPDKVEASIRQAYTDRYKEQPPKDFFKPRLTSLVDTQFYNPDRGLPQRRIPFLGFSDVSNLHVVLGQKGVVSSVHANNAEHIMDVPHDLDSAIEYLTTEKPSSAYSGLTNLKGSIELDVAGKIFSINGAAFSSTIGSEFSLSFSEPTIIALETGRQDNANILGGILLKALEAGVLNNVKAIALGRIGGKNVDLEQLNKGNYPQLAEFLKESSIPVFATQSPKLEHTWGHGGILSGSIVKPFANFAEAKITTKGDLIIEGRQSIQNINTHYKTNTLLKKIEQTTYNNEKHSDISLSISNAQAAQTPQNTKLDNMEFVATDVATLRRTNGTSRQVDSHGKMFVLSSPQLDPYVHSTLVESQLTGAMAGAKAVAIALPEDKHGEFADFTSENLPDVLQDFAKRHLNSDIPVVIIRNNEMAKGMVKGNVLISLSENITTEKKVDSQTTPNAQNVSDLQATGGKHYGLENTK